jgi:alpha-tubulin suppressor-like RCC1 family protein
VKKLEYVTSVSSGGQHSLALKADGTVWGWGLNKNGQLGDGSNSNRNTPVQVICE